MLLPSDPDHEVITIDSEFWDRLDELKTVALGESGRVRLGEQQIPTAHAAALVNFYGRGEPWNSYVAVHRNGSIDVGFGDRGGRDTKDREGEDARVFNLISLVGYSWAALELARNLALDPDGEWHLAFALVRTEGALLGNVGEGWAEPGTWENSVGGCADAHLLWHIELDRLPSDATASQEQAFAIGDRIEDAWGMQQRRYLDHRGESAGQFDARRIAH